MTCPQTAMTDLAHIQLFTPADLLYACTTASGRCKCSLWGGHVVNHMKELP